MVVALLEAVSFFLNSRFFLTLHFFEFAFRFFSFVLDVLVIAILISRDIIVIFLIVGVFGFYVGILCDYCSDRFRLKQLYVEKPLLSMAFTEQCFLC